MGPGEGDSVPGKESGPSTTVQGIGEKLHGAFLCCSSNDCFCKEFLSLSHVPHSFVGVLWVVGRTLGQGLVSEDTLSPLAAPTSLESSPGSCFGSV